MGSCDIHFIDCMGYWGLASQIISLLFLSLTFYKTFRNWIVIQSQHHQSIQLKKSQKRKVIINILSIVFQFFLFVSISLSIIIFFIYKNQQFQDIIPHKVNLWYKWSQIIFMNLLNSLNLTVGFIYWKAVRGYFIIAQQQSMPLIYSTKVKLVFLVFYILNSIIIALSLVLLLITDQAHYQKYQIKTVNGFNAVGVSCSTIMCLISRLLYQKYILNTIQMHKKAIRNEKIYSCLIAVSSLIRLTCVTLNLIGIDYYSGLRNFDQFCIDTTPYHAVVVLFMTIGINLLPPFIFSSIFSCAEPQRKKSHEQIKEYLVKNNDQSVRYL